MWKHVRGDKSVDDRNLNNKVSRAEYTAKSLFKTLLGKCMGRNPIRCSLLN